MTPNNPPESTTEVATTAVATVAASDTALSAATPAPVVLADDEEPGGAMTFFEHLTELRKRLISSLIALAIGAFIGVYVSKYFITWITHPMTKALSEAHLEPKLIYTHPAGYLNLIITLGVYLGIVLASPFVLYQFWLFVAPALYKHEKGAIAGFLFSTVFLFLGGIAFGYFVTLPYILKFLVSFQGPVVPMISINEYFDLILMILLGLGLVFELPILIFFLSLFGIVTPKFLWKNFRYAILVISVVAAVITPTPDATTMLIFMAPMLGLYVVSIGVSAVVVSKREKRLAAEQSAA
jgi:sec-independent protein translocase protein TatC